MERQGVGYTAFNEDSALILLLDRNPSYGGVINLMIYIMVIEYEAIQKKKSTRAIHMIM